MTELRQVYDEFLAEKRKILTMCTIVLGITLLGAVAGYLLYDVRDMVAIFVIVPLMIVMFWTHYLIYKRRIENGHFGSVASEASDISRFVMQRNQRLEREERRAARNQ